MAPAFPSGTNLGAMIAPHCADDQPWLIEVTPGGGERVLTYGDLRDRAGAIAQGLIDAGLGTRKARIGLISLNSAEYLLAYYGIMQAGCCAVPMGWKLTPDTIEYILGDAAVERVYADAKWSALLAGKVSVDALAAPGTARPGRTRLNPVPAAMATDPATILYTSGSTGVPKGVPLTHGGYIWTLRAVEVNGGQAIREGAARVLTAAPLSHMNALFLTKTVTAYGGTLVLMTSFDARAFLQAASTHQCSVVTAVPTPVAATANATQGSSVRVENGVVKFFFASGTSSLPAEAGKALSDIVQGVGAGKMAVVSGFHDASGDPAKNAELAKERALMVRDTLKALGVAEDKVELKKPEQTVGTGNPDEARRVEVMLK